jgi:hypothetical protein
MIVIPSHCEECQFKGTKGVKEAFGFHIDWCFLYQAQLPFMGRVRECESGKEIVIK